MRIRFSLGRFLRMPSCALWLVYFLFFLSGISGLMYEVVWLRMLTRILGNTVYAASTVLAAFMAGLALGSFVIGRFVDRARRPLLWYGLLELGIGLTALCSLWLPDGLLPAYRTMYELAGESRAWLTAGQAGIALVALVLPTALMGATLPTLCAFGTRRHPAFGRCIGTLYAVNVFGAIVGVLASGFVLIGAVGETDTVLLGVALNTVVAAAAMLLGRSVPEPTGVADTSAPLDRPGTESPEWVVLAQGASRLVPYSDRVRRVVLVCFAASGFVALGNEVVWSRMLTLYQGTSIYAFSAMLAVILAGMGMGSLLGGKWLDRWSDPLLAFALLELAVGLAGVLTLHCFDQVSAAKPDLTSGQHLGGFALAPVLFVGPLGLFSGMVFPVAARCYAVKRTAAGRCVARLYAWNTVGCIAGALAAGFAFIPWLGAGCSGTLLAALSLLLGLQLLWEHPRGYWREAGLVKWGLVGGCALLLATVGDPHHRLMQRHMEQSYRGRPAVYRHVEEAAGTTTAFGALASSSRDKHLWVNGHGVTVLVPATKLMAHLPIWLADDPRDVLVICFGMGTTVRSASRHEGLQVWTVELVPGVLDSFAFFHPDSPELLQRANIHPVVDDGRNFLLTHLRQFDVITVDPAPPLYSAGTVNLYSQEFLQLCRDRIRPGGTVCLWVPPANESEVKMIMRTFLDVFNHVSVWAGPAQQTGLQGFYLIGGRGPLCGIREKIHKGYAQAAVVEDLLEWGPECDGPEKILELYLADERELRDFVSGAPIITDDRPYTEFPLWRALLDRGDYYRELNAPRLRQYLKLAPTRRDGATRTGPTASN